jgi:hypothetical protein
MANLKKNSDVEERDKKAFRSNEPEPQSGKITHSFLKRLKCESFSIIKI